MKRKPLLLLLISILSDKLLGSVFFCHGSWVSFRRGGVKEMKEYWYECAFSNDMNLNVKGQHLLNQRLSKNRVFGNPLMTVSAAKHQARLTEAGSKWAKRLNAIDTDHYAKAYESYKNRITNDYNNLQP